jgi:AraC-like DNA-binding protein/TolB-like protein/tetratricopeptide (TPR) repeat protein
MEKQPSIEDQFLATVRQIIENNISNENFTVEDLAQHARLSQSMLHRKLKRLTGKSTNVLIIEIRLAKAKELLENDVATVSEVAYRVGFKDPSYFNKVFKKYYHLSPGSVRKSLPDNLIYPSTDQSQELLGSSKSKGYGSFIKVIVIILIIIITAGGIYYLFSIMRPHEQSLAVLPLDNLTGQPENAYLVDGIHDALIGELGQIESLRVISKTSTLQYRNSKKTLKDIARELGVNTIVEGSVTIAGDTLRILLQMINVFPKERHLLTNEYYDDIHHVLTIHSTAVKDIVQKIRIKLTKEEEQFLTKSRTVDPETYKAYLRGMYYLNQGTQESFETGLSYLREAIERDPADPFAYAGLALGYAIMGHGMLYSERSFRLATAAANKALILDPTSDEAYTALALLYLYQSWDWPMAKEAFERAIAHNPNNEIAHAHFAWYYVLFGDMEKSIYHARKAVTLDPLSPSYNSWLAWLYYHNKEYDKAEYWARESLTLKENLPYGNLVLGWTYLHKKQYQKAIEAHEKLPFSTTRWKWLRCRTYVLTDNREKALAIWNEVEHNSEENWTNPFYTGMIAGTLGFTDKAFELLNEACEKKYYPASLIDVFPSAEFIRDDPRYNTLLQKLHLPYTKTLITAHN